MVSAGRWSSGRGEERREVSRWKGVSLLLSPELIWLAVDEGDGRGDGDGAVVCDTFVGWEDRKGAVIERGVDLATFEVGRAPS